MRTTRLPPFEACSLPFRVMQSNKLTYRFFDQSDLKFRDLRNTLDTVCVSLRKEGVGAIRKHVAMISRNDERIMWESGVLGTASPWALVRAVFFVVGLHFSLRGGQEHRQLTVSVYLVMVLTARIAITNMLSTVQRTVRENLPTLTPTRLAAHMPSQDQCAAPLGLLIGTFPSFLQNPRLFTCSLFPKYQMTQNNRDTSQLQLALKKMIVQNWLVCAHTTLTTAESNICYTDV